MNTLGWFGFGLGEPTSGSMPGSDVVYFTFSQQDETQITDAYALEFTHPEVDTCQDWKLVILS